MRKPYAFFYYCWILLLTFSLFGCGRPQVDTYSRDFFAMDTYITCKIPSENQALAQQGLDCVEKAFRDIDRLTNRFDPQSEVMTINKNAGAAPVKVSQDVFNIVKTGIEWGDRTEGSFNILIGGAMDLWGFGTEHHAVPAPADLKEALRETDCSKIVLDEAQSTIFLPDKGMVLDLGGIAKGYATDKAVAALKDLGIKNALINAGGNVYALGSKADGSPWKVGVQDPQNPKGIKTVLAGRDQALVSSGDYQRFFELNGVRYHHILDPATGSPARASAGTTVIMKSATIADLLSTALFVKGPVKGIEMAEGTTQVDAVIIITGDGKMTGTKNLQQYIVEP